VWLNRINSLRFVIRDRSPIHRSKQVRAFLTNGGGRQVAPRGHGHSTGGTPGRRLARIGIPLEESHGRRWKGGERKELFFVLQQAVSSNEEIVSDRKTLPWQ
jgi:hypothetical protein